MLTLPDYVCRAAVWGDLTVGVKTQLRFSQLHESLEFLWFGSFPPSPSGYNLLLHNVTFIAINSSI